MGKLKSTIGSSWRTSVVGYALLIGAICQVVAAVLDADPNTVPNWESLVAALTGVGLIASRDHVVSSEQAGIR